MDLRKLNSLTKYPGIPTYHALGGKGRLTEQVLYTCIFKRVRPPSVDELNEIIRSAESL